MREILFRGKRIGANLNRDSLETGTMVYGSLFVDRKGQAKIKWYNEHHGSSITSIVDPETISQYTGLTDKNGKKIFEGDILKGMGGLHRVYFDTSLACFEWQKISGNWHESFSGFADEYEIIGNIHDNPELLKGGEGDEK